MPIKPKSALAAVAVALLTLAPAARSPAASPDSAPSAAISVVEIWDSALLDSMKDARELGPRGRYRRLAPTMDAAFDMAAITRQEAAARWAGLTPDQKARLIGAFGGFEAAQFASWFDAYVGQSFQIGGTRAAADGEVEVTAVMSGGGIQALSLDYVLRPGEDGVWRIVDIRYGGWLSIVERRRSEFSVVLGQEGVEALIARLDSMRRATLSRTDTIAAPHVLQPRTDQWSLPVYPIN